MAGVVLSAGCIGSTDKTTTSQAVSTSTTDYIAEALAFPSNDYTVQTKKIGTIDGMTTVKYRLYRHLTYVADPVDPDYQSLDVAVPVEIDGEAVDTDNVPIVLNISVSDYMSSPNLSPALPTPSTTGTVSTDTSTEETAGEAAELTVDATNTVLNANVDQALMAGYVVVSPGCRGSNNVTDDSDYYGKAPAAIVDLKCAVKYIRFNDDVMPGTARWIVVQGSDAGGGLAALLAASGDSDLYQSYFEKLGAADVSDSVYACAVYSPNTDLAHADGAYEWQFGNTPLGSDLVDPTLSSELASSFAAYLTSLDLVGQRGFGSITADNYGEYLVQTYLAPAATDYLNSLSEDERQVYLVEHPWLLWDGGSASFAWKDYVDHVGRTKGLPAFDAFDLSTPECRLFGDASTDARHFTEFSLQQTGEGISPAVDPDLATATLDTEVQAVVDLMNPMHFVTGNNSGCAYYWWVRQAAEDAETSLAVPIDLATGLENLGKDVHTSFYWEAGHGANEDAAHFADWIAFIISTGS